MKQRRGEWQDLPHGGAIRREDALPVEVSDKGAWQLDENRILRDAEEISGTKLTWMHLSRARRWHKAPITGVLRSGDEWNWCMAKVAAAACDSCGIEAGNRWIGESSSDRVWVCETCAARGVLDKRS
jgi:hypothetical protein